MKKILCTLPLFLFVATSLFAQQNPTDPILSMEITTVSTDTTADGRPALVDTVLFDAHMIVSLFDTTSVLTLSVKLGSSQGVGDLLTKTFTFDSQGNTGNGTSYTRSPGSYDIDLGLGSYRGLLGSSYFAELQIERPNHSTTAIVKFSR